MAPKEQVAVIGAGALGSALARRLRQCGYALCAVISHTREHAEGLASEVGAPIAATSPASIPHRAGVVFCCVPDDALPGLARELATAYPDEAAWIVAHTSGALSADVLGSAGLHGAGLMSFHPMQTFTRDTPPEAFAGIPIGLEGDAGAVAVGRRIALDVGARPFEIPPGGKVRYHLAASIASNFAVTLAALSQEVLASIGITGQDATDLLEPLVETTLRKLAMASPGDVLTGPIVRGDVQTVQTHLQALQEHVPHLAAVYKVLGRETVRLARRSGRLPEHQAEQLRSALSDDEPLTLKK